MGRGVAAEWLPAVARLIPAKRSGMRLLGIDVGGLELSHDVGAPLDEARLAWFDA